MSQPIGIVVEVAQRARLWAEETLAVGVILVAAEVGDATAVDADDDAATGLAQRARVQVCRRHRCCPC
jgi:hypothetical protein